MTSKKIFLAISGSGDTFAWFRKDFFVELKNSGYRVIAMAPDISANNLEELNQAGIEFNYFSLDRKSFNLLNLIFSIYKLQKIIRLINPDVIFSYMHKSIIVTSLAARITKKNNLFSMITGLGHAFDDQTVKDKFIKLITISLLKVALSNNKKVFFQNPDDSLLFINKKIVRKEQVAQVNGSGVNLEKFPFSTPPSQPIFMTMARLLKSKGLIEFAEASKLMKELYPNARFLIYGYPDKHKDSIDENEIKNIWPKRYGIEYMGFCSNPANEIAKSSVFVLLSYQEGTPRVALEALAIGRAVITTDAVGCRETVKNNHNGFLVKPKDHISSFKAMQKLMDYELRALMSKKSRILAEEKFDVKKINKVLINEMQIN